MARLQCKVQSRFCPAGVEALRQVAGSPLNDGSKKNEVALCYFLLQRQGCNCRISPGSHLASLESFLFAQSSRILGRGARSRRSRNETSRRFGFVRRFARPPTLLSPQPTALCRGTLRVLFSLRLRRLCQNTRPVPPPIGSRIADREIQACEVGALRLPPREYRCCLNENQQSRVQPISVDMLNR